MTDMKRRVFLRGSLIAGTGSMIIPQVILAKWNEAVFTATSINDALKALNYTHILDSPNIQIKAPDIAENGAVVPVTITTSIKNVKVIFIIAANNPVPVTASFTPSPGTQGYVGTRIKMGKSGNIIALVQVEDKVFRATKEVKVTIGGCGG